MKKHKGPNNSKEQMDGISPLRPSLDGPRPFLKVRGDLGMPPGLRPVQLGHIQARPPPLIRINQDMPMPRLTFGGPTRPMGSIQQRPVGTPGNLSGVVNIIPRQAVINRTENGLGPQVRSPNHLEVPQQQQQHSPKCSTPGPQQQQQHSPKCSTPGPLQSKPADCQVLPSVQQTIRALNRSSLAMTPPASIEPVSRPSPSSAGVMGIKNLTPIDSANRPKMPSFRPVQVRTLSVSQSSPKVSTSPLARSNSTDTPVTSIKVTDTPVSTNKKNANESSKKFVGSETSKKNIENVSVVHKVEDKIIEKDISTVVVGSNPSLSKNPSLQSRFVRRADGKGFVRRDVFRPRDDNSLLNKKKKKPYRGVKYRFDGSCIKKRANKKAPPLINLHSLSNELNPTVKLIETTSVLSYLGIQRRSSAEEDQPVYSKMRKSEPKAKKSCRPRASEQLTESVSNSHSAEAISLSSSNSSVPSRKRGLDSSDSTSAGNDATGAGNRDGDQENKRQRESTDNAKSNTVNPSKAAQETREPKDLICECDKAPSELEIVPEGDEAERCEAVECVGPSKIGCGNPCADRFLRRSGSNLGYLQLCALHVERLKNHKACAYCGEFCAQGPFLLCRPTQLSPFHMMHVSCSLKGLDKDGIKRCPHCHSTDGIFEVQLKASAKRMPLTLLTSYAKMTFAPRPNQLKNKNGGSKRGPELRRKVVTYTLPNGKVISSEGLPNGLADEELEKVINALEDKDQVKHTTRNMLAPTKSGDNVRLLQMLALDYSVRQKINDAAGGTLLHVAAAEGHVLTAHILFQVGAELNALNKDDCTPLMLACAEGHTDMVKYLLHLGADMVLRGHDGMTCLHLAAQNGHLECVHAILTQNMFPRRMINETDDGGWTPLVWACENKHEDVIRYLLESGSDPLCADVDGNIALHWAVLSGSMVSCELLLDYGCDINKTNNIGDTAMHIALRRDHYECAVLFLMRSARLDIKNENGEIAEDCMKVHKNPKCKMIVKLTTTINGLMRDKKSEPMERVICKDLTRGKESVPIPVINGVDDAPEPNDYVYVAKNCQTKLMPIDRNISNLKHCLCVDNCSELMCKCSSEKGVKSWYDKTDGQLKQDFDFAEPPSIYECNDMCSCNVNLCTNRLLQHGITAKLQVFRTEWKGWGVRAWSDIPRGSFVCEYVGEYISDLDAETREDSYLFDLENKEGGETFCLDANKYGNIARFINHSCSPNVTPIKVFVEHQDTRFPHMSLFANRDIPKGEELGFDYGEKFWVVKHKYFTCHCGTEKCRYNKNRIGSFLQDYYKRMREPMPADLAKHPNLENENAKALKKADKLPGSKSKQNDKDETGSTISDPESTTSSSSSRRKKSI